MDNSPPFPPMRLDPNQILEVCQSQKDCVPKPRVARNKLPWAFLQNPVGIQGKDTFPKSNCTQCHSSRLRVHRRPRPVALRTARRRPNSQPRWPRYDAKMRNAARRPSARNQNKLWYLYCAKYVSPAEADCVWRNVPRRFEWLFPSAALATDCAFPVPRAETQGLPG